MPVPEGRMRGIREKLVPLAIPGGFIFCRLEAGGPIGAPPLGDCKSAHEVGFVMVAAVSTAHGIITANAIAIQAA